VVKIEIAQSRAACEPRTVRVRRTCRRRPFSAVAATCHHFRLWSRPVRTTVLAVLVALVTTFGSVVAVGQSAGRTAQRGGDVAVTAEKKSEVLTLERIFPEKSLFGPGASSPEFSFDGRYGAFLWRPFAERRHGPDIWIHDFETGETTRITMVSVMSEFQEDARKVRDDRVKKWQDRNRTRRPARPAAAAPARADAPPAAPARTDPVSGVWEGRVVGDDAILPPDGIAVALELKLGDDDSVSGMVRSMFMTVAIAEGRFDRETNALSFVVRGENDQAGLSATVDATIDEKTISGTIRVADGPTLRFSGERTEPEAAADDGRAGEQNGGVDVVEPAPTAGPTPLPRTRRDNGRQSVADIVDDKDADDTRAPRYAGIQAFTWSPKKQELLFVAAGDIYRYQVAEDRITRLTRTREDERDVKWLPDGSGYTYMRGSDLIRVSFDSHLLEQITPRLPGGETMTGYALSPDGTRVAILATKGSSYQSRSRQVNIIKYRERFAQVEQVRRHVSDDPFTDFEYVIYLFELDGLMEERGQLKRVHTHKQSGPRDILRVPEWSPDSSRIAFSVFQQASGQVEILEARFVDRDAPIGEDDPKPGVAPVPTDAVAGRTPDETKSVVVVGGGATMEKSGDDRKIVDDGPIVPDKDPEPRHDIQEARVVYRFLHNGGPNTPGLIRPIYLADSRRMVFLTEVTGFRQLHVLDPTYEQLEQLTRGRFEIYPLEPSRDRARMYALSTRDDPAQQHVWSIDLDSGEMTRLTVDDGFHDTVAVSDCGRHVLGNRADFGAPNEMHATVAAIASGATDAGTSRVLTDSHPEATRALVAPAPEYFTYKNRHGQTIHGHMFKPSDWSPEDARPLLIYVYGGPLDRRKMITRGSFAAPSYFFARYMAEVHGYVTATIDPRGASGYGGLFEKANYEQVGKPQVEDLVDGARWFIANHGVDEKRVGLHGWSFGGFQTQMCMYTEPDVFAVGIAGAGPTEWENYNSWYSTGTIGSSRTGQTDLSKFSLLPLAKNLKGRLLLVHGVEDSNVLYQDTVRVYRELLKAGKEALVDLFIDPTGGHGMGGDVKTINRYRKYEDFLITHLGTGRGASPPAAEAESSDAEATDAADADESSTDDDAVEEDVEGGDDRDGDGDQPDDAAEAGTATGVWSDAPPAPPLMVW